MCLFVFYVLFNYLKTRTIIQDSDKDGIISDLEFLKVIEKMYEFKGKSKKE